MPVTSIRSGPPPHNANVLANGYFEDFTGNHLPAGWNLPYIVNLSPAISTCYPTWPMPNNNPKLSSEEVRSGIYSMWARIKSPASDHNFPRTTIYPVLLGHLSDILPYFSISQDFNFQQPPPPRKPKSVTTPPIDFTIKPNPSALGITLTGSIQNLPANQSYQVSIYTPEGTLAYLGNGYTSEFTISKTLPAGVYYVKVWGKGFSNYKRIVVVG